MPYLEGIVTHELSGKHAFGTGVRILEGECVRSWCRKGHNQDVTRARRFLIPAFVTCSFIRPLAMVLGCALAGCSDRALWMASAEDRTLGETTGFVVILLMAILGLVGPTVYKLWRK